VRVCHSVGGARRLRHRHHVSNEPVVSQMGEFTSSRAFRVAGPKAFAEAGIT
jgi:hypothetical protein